MKQLIKLDRPQLHVAHESEVLQLRKALATLQVEMNEMKKNINNTSAQADQRKILLPSKRQHHLISIDDIMYCEADGNYTKVFLVVKNKTKSTIINSCFLISKTLKSITGLISSNEFIRCHQSFLVNKKHVTGYSHEEGLRLTMSDEKRIPVSRRNKKLIMGMF